MEKLSRSLEITIISAEDLSLQRRSIKKNGFVIVRTDSHNFQKTTMDPTGGNPSWNQKLDLQLPNSAQFITVEVQCKTASGVRSVGAVHIPVSDFIADYMPTYYLHFLSYRLRECDGQRNGIVNLSIKMKIPEYLDRKLPPSTALPICKNSNGVAIGIPVSHGKMV